jgi:hypothetical protein
MATKTSVKTPAKTALAAAPRKRPAAKAPAARKAAKAATTEIAKPLSGEDVMRIFQLGKGSNSVELKLSIPMGGHRTTVRSIGLDPVEAQPRQAFYFDTPDLALNRAGLVVRARRIQGGRADTVVKLRPVEPDTIDPELRRSAAFKVEVDVMPGGYVCSASFKGVCTGKEVQEVADGKLELSKILSKEQREFFSQHAPAGVALDQLVVLGPTFLLKAKHQPKNFDRPITVEMWFYPDDTRILEVSTKCLPEETYSVGSEFKTYLADRGIVLGAKQEPKTKTAIAFFGAMLRQVAS